MITEISQDSKKRFEAVYGKETWARFCGMIYAQVRPRVVQESFVSSKKGTVMGKQPYYKWEARARQVKEEMSRV